MSLLVFLLLFLVILALAAALLRRMPLLSGVIVAAGLGWLAWWLWGLPLEDVASVSDRIILLDQPGKLLGFTFLPDALVRAPLLLIVAWGALFALVSAMFRVERSFTPTIPLFIAALMIFLSADPLLWAPFWLILVAIFMGIMAQGSQPRPARAALRTLLTPILAFPFFLFTAWVFSQPAIAAEDPELWTNAWRALLVGMLILASPVPLHGWIPALGEASSPFAGAFLVGVWQIAIYAFLRRLLFNYPTVIDFVNPGVWLPWIGVIQMMWAGVFMFGSQRLGQLWGYLLLWVFGAAFLAWGLTGELGSDAIFWLFLVTPFVLTLTAAGLQSITHAFGENPPYDRLHGVSERLPLSTLGFVAGGLFLLGWPLGALFPMRLATWQVVEFRAGNIFLWGMLSLALGVLGVIRAARHLTSPLADTGLRRETRQAAWTIGLLLAAGLVIAIHPGLLTPLTDKMLIWFNMF